MDLDHTDWWTRHRRIHLTRRGRTLLGAGIPGAVLQYAASLLGVPMTRRPLSDPGNEYTDEVRLGEEVGHLHDDCFMGFDEPSAELEAALLAGVGALLATYLRRESVPAELLVAFRDRLRDGWSVEIDANPRTATLRIRAFPADAGWWARAFAPRLTVRADAV